MEIIKMDSNYFNSLQSELDAEHLADLEIDLQLLKEKLKNAKGPRALRHWQSRIARKEAEIASLKIYM